MHQNRKRNISKAKKLPYFSERECWNLDHHLARIIAGGLHAFICMKRYGVPNAYAENSPKPDEKLKKASEAWDEDLRKMLWSFEEVAGDYPSDPHNIWFNEHWRNLEKKGIEPFDIKEGKLLDNMPETPKEVWDDVKVYREKVQEGLDLFGKHFQELWD